MCSLLLYIFIYVFRLCKCQRRISFRVGDFALLWYRVNDSLHSISAFLATKEPLCYRFGTRFHKISIWYLEIAFNRVVKTIIIICMFASNQTLNLYFVYIRFVRLKWYLLNGFRICTIFLSRLNPVSMLPYRRFFITFPSSM